MPGDFDCHNPRHKFRVAAHIRNQIEQLSHSEFQVQTLCIARPEPCARSSSSHIGPSLFPYGTCTDQIGERARFTID
jgi:hypothetical protein